MRWRKKGVRRSVTVTILFSSFGLWGAACGEKAFCDEASLVSALERAGEGDLVRVGDCRVEGSFLVPPGVTLQGSGVESSVIVSPAGAAVILEPGATETRLSNLTIESDGEVGVLAYGEGSVALENLSVRPSRGIGVGGQDVSSLALSDVEIIGPITPENVTDLSPGESPEKAAEKTATYGLVILDVADARLDRVEVRGFAYVAAHLDGSTVTWRQGGIEDTARHGLAVFGGSTSLEDVSICRVLQGFFPIAMGAVLADDAAVESRRVTICENEGFGIYQIGGSAEHVDMKAVENRGAAIFAREMSAGLEVSGPETEIRANHFVGIAVIDSSNVTIKDAQVVEGMLQTRMDGETRSIEVGDGINLVGSIEGIRMEGLRLSDNGRAGILIDLGGTGTVAADWLEGIEVSTSGDQLGVVAQNGEIPVGWDDGVERTGSAEANDTGFLSSGMTLDHAGMVELPASDDVAGSGGSLDAFLGR